MAVADSLPDGCAVDTVDIGRIERLIDALPGDLGKLFSAQEINDAGDGPAVFVILGLGAIIMILVFWVEFRYEPPWWLHVLIWGPLTFGLAVWFLRVLKALLIAQQYRHRSTALDDE